MIVLMGLSARDSGERADVRVKALTFRSFVTAVEKHGKRDAVLTRVPRDTAALIESPPLPGSWMDLWTVWHIIQALEEIGGMPLVREVSRQATDDARRPYMRIVDSVLKMFGTSPATLFKRMNSLVTSFIQGVDYAYSVRDDRSGIMQVVYKCQPAIPDCVFVSLTPTFQTLLESCGHQGLVSPYERLSTHSARYVIQW